MISIVIPNFNGSHFLRQLIPNLKRAAPKNSEIIIVDNGSTDDSYRYFSQLIAIKNSCNLGFAAAVNQGINAAKNDYVLLLNNDIILDQHWFKNIIAAIHQNPQAACFCGTILNKTGSEVESQGISFEWSGKCLQNKQHSAGIVWGASGAVVVYKKDILLQIGLFDEKYFAYIEDVDVAFRLHKNGYQTVLVPQAIAYHLGGGTSDKMGNFRAKQTLRNWIYFIFKNYSPREIMSNLPSIIVERLRNLSYLLKSINVTR